MITWFFDNERKIVGRWQLGDNVGDVGDSDDNEGDKDDELGENL